MVRKNVTEDQRCMDLSGSTAAAAMSSDGYSQEHNVLVVCKTKTLINAPCCVLLCFIIHGMILKGVLYILASFIHTSKSNKTTYESMSYGHTVLIPLLGTYFRAVIGQ